MTYGNGTFVGVGGGFRLISYDGANWTTTTTSPSINPAGVAFGGGMFLMFGTNSQNKANYVLQSTNGTTWTTIYTSSNTLTAAAYGNNTWVLIGSNEIATATITSSNWNWSEFQPSFSPSGIAYGNGMFVIGGYLSTGQLTILSSSDGISWQFDSTLPEFSHIPALSGIVYGNGLFVAMGYYNIGTPSTTEISYAVVCVSSNLVQWIETDGSISGSGPFPSCIANGGNEFLVSVGLNVYTSSDGYAWSLRNVLGPFSAFTYGQGTFVGSTNAGGASSIFQSGVFSTQSNSPATTLSISTYPGLTINGTAGAVYQIQSTTNLNSIWLPLTNFPLPYSQFIWVDTSSPVVGQKFYRSIQLQ